MTIDQPGSRHRLPGEKPGLLGERRGVAVAVRRGKVVWIGPEPELPRPYRMLPEIRCEGRLMMPGMVDAGAALLGPIRSSGRPDPVELTEIGARLTGRMLARGITLLDLRVGGGVDPTVETLHLAVARSVGDRLPLDINVTWRCSPEMPVEEVRTVMGPTAARLASCAELRCRGDSSDLVARIEACRPLRIRLVCEEMRGRACDHLLDQMLSVERVEPGRLGGLGPVPLASWRRPDEANRLWEAGLRPGFATGSDPANRLMLGMGPLLMITVDLFGLEADRAVWSATRGGALACADKERGRLRLGGPADLMVVDGETVEDLLRRPDGNPAWRVVVGGREVVE